VEFRTHIKEIVYHQMRPFVMDEAERPTVPSGRTSRSISH
jgi:hypothetical protein